MRLKKGSGTPINKRGHEHGRTDPTDDRCRYGKDQTGDGSVTSGFRERGYIGDEIVLFLYLILTSS